MRSLNFWSYFLITLSVFFFAACNKVDVDYSSSSLNNLKFKLVGENSSNNEIKVYRNQVYSIDYRKKDKIKSDLKIRFEYSLIDNSKWNVSDILSEYKSEDTLKSSDELLKFRMQVQPTLPMNEFINLKVKFVAEDNSVEFVPSELVIKIDNSTQPPTAVTITSPPANSYINASNQNNFEITGTCDSGNTVELSSQSPQTVVLFPGPLPCLGNSFSTGLVDVSGFFDGAVQIDIKQKNQLGEVSPVTSLSLTKDTILPALSVTSHNDYDIIDTSTISTFSISGTCSESGSEIKITGDISSVPNPICSGGAWSTSLDTTGLLDGNINLVFKHFDSAGNQNASLTRTLVKSSSGIVAILSSKPSAFTNLNTLSVNVSGAGIVSYKYALGKEISCSSAVYSSEYPIGTPITKMTSVSTGALTTSTLSSGDGTYVLCVLGKNSSSIFQSASAATMYSWVFDQTAPVVGTIDDSVYFNSATATPSISWSGINDATSGIYKYWMAIGTFAGGADVLAWTDVGVANTFSTGLSLSYGNRYFATLKVVDRAGNYNYLYGDGWWVVQPLVLSESNISLITGESYSLGPLLSGGRLSYSGTSISGFLNSSTLIYSVPVSSVAATENVTLSDSAGQTISLSMKIRAFIDKFSDYGYQGTSGQIYVGDLKIQPTTGHLFSANIELNSRGNWTWVVKKSTDNGNIWNLVDSFNLESGLYSEAKSIAFDAYGNIYAVGNANDQNGVTHWIIRKSIDNGSTWNTITNFQWQTGSISYGKGIFITNTDKIYSVGYGISSASGGIGRWITLQINLDGSGLSVVDQYSSGANFSAAESVTMDSTGNLYVAGNVSGFVGSAWLVRKSTDGGVSWTVVDSFQPHSTYNFFPKNIKADNTGNIYVVGYGYFGVPNSSWIVRRSSDGGSTWYTSSQFNAYTSKDTKAINLEFDSGANVYVVGTALDNSSNTYLVIRKFNGSVWNTTYLGNLSNAPGIGQLSGVVVDGSNISTAGYFFDDSNNPKMIFIQSNNSGSSWTTINQYFNEIRTNNEINDLVEFSGGLFSGGYQSDSNFIRSWHVKKSADSGQTWNVLENYKLSTGKNSGLNSFAINSSSGSLYSVGFGEDSSSLSHWIVRKSSDYGENWSTVDDFSYVAGFPAVANAAYSSSIGSLFVVGEAKSNASEQKWIVRKSNDNGATWNTVDSYNSTSFKAAAYAINEASGNIVVAGADQQATGVKATIRYSTDGGSNWSFGDQFVYSTGKPATYKTMARDSLGNLYVSGHIEDSSGVARWIVRKSTTGGATWSTVYDINFVTGKNSEIHKLSADSLGNIYAAGEYTGSDNSRYWILRKSSDYGVTWVTIDKKAISDVNSSAFKGMTPCLSDRLCSGLSVEESLFKGKKWLLRILSP